MKGDGGRSMSKGSVFSSTGDGGKGGSFRSSLYAFVCFRRFALVGGGSGPDSSGFSQRVLTIKRAKCRQTLNDRS